MTPGRDRLVKAWAALEVRGCVVERVDVGRISEAVADALARIEERRLAALADQYAPGPAAYTAEDRPVGELLVDLVKLVHKAVP